MKIAPVIDAMKTAKEQGSAQRYRLLQAGQNYDRATFGDFCEQPGISEPDISLARKKPSSWACPV
jgi:hypothetical protein